MHMRTTSPYEPLDLETPIASTDRVQTSGLRKVFLLNDNANDDDKEPIPMLGRNDCIKYLGLNDGREFGNRNISYLKELMTESISKVKKLVTAGPL